MTGTVELFCLEVNIKQCVDSNFQAVLGYLSKKETCNKQTKAHLATIFLTVGTKPNNNKKYDALLLSWYVN